MTSNGSPQDGDYNSARLGSVVYLCIVGACGIIANSLVIFVFWKYPKLRTMAFNTAQNTLSTFWTYKHLQHVKGGHITVINLRRKIYDVILTMQSTSCECQLDVPTTVRRLNYMS